LKRWLKPIGQTETKQRKQKSHWGKYYFFPFIDGKKVSNGIDKEKYCHSPE
jgi:hypothetical protein